MMSPMTMLFFFFLFTDALDEPCYDADCPLSFIWVKIAKFNTETKELLYWTEENCWPSEPVFVPRPNGESEDDGKNTLHKHDAPYIYG